MPPGQRLLFSFKDDSRLLTFAPARLPGKPEFTLSRMPAAFYSPALFETCFEPYTSVDTEFTSLVSGTDSGTADSTDSAFTGNG